MKPLPRQPVRDTAHRRRARGASLPLALACVTAALSVMLFESPAQGRTILMGVEACDQAAVIRADAPRLSWAARRHTSYNNPGSDHHGFVTTSVEIDEHSAMLMRFDLDAIPSGQRIVHAELIVPVRGKSGDEVRFYLWRVTADWGIGVCYDYRYINVNPDGDGHDKIAWAKPGARGIASDRATRPTDIVRIPEDERSDEVINVTEDVELWYDGRAPNHGWMFTVEDPEARVRIDSPIWESEDRWTLRITYEPRDD